MATWGPIGFEAADGWADEDYVDEHGAPWNVNDVTISTDVGLNNPDAGFGVFGSGRLRIDTHNNNSTLVADMSAQGSQVATHTTSLGANQRILIDEAFPDRAVDYAAGNCSIIIQLRCSTDDGGDCYFAVLERAAGDTVEGTIYAHVIRVAANAMVESLASTTWTGDEPSDPFSFQAEIDGSVIKVWAEDHPGESPVAMDGTNLRLTYDTSGDGTVLSSGDYGGWGIHRQYDDGSGIHGQPYADNITAESLAGGAASASISPATITVTAHPVTVTPGQAATTYAQAPATVTAHPVTATAGVVAVTVGPAQLTTTAHSVSATAGAASASISPAALSVTAHPVTVAAGVVARTIGPATFTATAHPVTAEPPPAATPPAYVGHVHKSYNTIGDSFSIIFGTDIDAPDDGDLMVVYWWANIDPFAMGTLPSGWVTRETTPASGGEPDIAMGMATKTASSESGTITFTSGITDTTNYGALFVVFSGVDGAAPEVSASEFNIDEPDPINPSITTTSNGALVLSAVATRNIAATWDAPPSQGSAITLGAPGGDGAVVPVFELSWFLAGSPGPTGTVEHYTDGASGNESVGIISGFAPVVATGPESATVAPATVTVTAGTVTATPGTAASSIDPATSTVTAHPVTASAGEASTSIEPVSTSITAGSVTATAGQASATFGPASLTVTAHPVDAAPAGSASASTSPAEATVTAHPVTATPGIASVTISPTLLSAQAGSALATPGAASRLTTPASLSVSAQPVTATPVGSETRNVGPATATATAHPVTVAEGVAPRAINPATATVTAHPVTVAAGVVAVTISPATATATAHTVTVAPLPASRTIGPATGTVTGHPVSATLGVASRPVDSATGTITAHPVSATPGVASRIINPATVTVTAHATGPVGELQTRTINAATATVTAHTVAAEIPGERVSPRRPMPCLDMRPATITARPIEIATRGRIDCC